MPSGGVGLKAVPYCRVSTDDKGQDPRRQLARINAWATAEKVELTEPVMDEGSSADKTNPFDRKAFKEAIARAKEAHADAIVVEDPDRFTRKGTQKHFYFKMKLEEDHRLKLWIADRSLEAQDANEGQLMEAVKSYIAKQNNDNHRRRVLEGMARARALSFASGNIESSTAAVLFERMAAACRKLGPGHVLTCHVTATGHEGAWGPNFNVSWNLPEDPMPWWVKFDVEDALAFLEEIA